MSQVIINDIPPYTQVTATLGQTVFSNATWTANAASDVVVYVTPAGDEPDDATQRLSYPSDYSVAFVGALLQVEVTLVTPSASGDTVTITRMTPADRMNLYSNTNFLPSMLNNDFGILTLVDQQAQLVNQMIGPRYNYSATINLTPERDTIIPILGPNETWQMNAAGTAIEAITISQGSGTITQIDTGLGLTGGPITSTGTISFDVMNANSFWGNITGSTALPAMVPTTYFLKSANNLSDLTDVAQARINLGLQIGVNVQAWSAALDSIAGLTTSANELIYTTAPDTYSLIAASPNSVLVTNASSVPSLSTTLPLAVQNNITALGLMSEALNMNSHQINNVTDPTNPQDAATMAYITAQTTNVFLPLLGGTMQGQIDMGNHKIVNMTDPSSAQDAVTINYLNTQLALKLSLSGGTMTGAINMGSHFITNLLDPLNPQDACTKNYADMIATGLTVQPACYAATTANLTAVYVNGASGIGATLTNSGALAAFSVDGVSPPTNARILVWNQSSTLQNGIYTLTNQGSGAVAWILTRATDYDQPAEIQPGDLVIINNGTLYAGTSFIETASVSAIGTDPILFSQFTFSATNVLLKANNLSDVANKATSFDNISPLTTKGDLIGYSTSNIRVAVGGSNTQILQVDSTAAAGISWSTATYPKTTTANQLLYSSSTNTVVGLSTLAGGVLVTDSSSVPQFLTNPGVAGKILQSANAAIPAWSTPTYPSASGAAGKIIISDGTNNVYSTPTYPNVATLNHILIGDGTNITLSVPAYPNASGASRTLIVSNGTNFINTTETWAVPGASGNVLTSDGTNWISSTPTGTGTVNTGLINQVAWYAANGTAVSGLATLANGVLVTSAGSVPSISTTLPANLNITTPLITTGLKDANGVLILGLTPTASAVNYIEIVNAATLNNPKLNVTGSDSSINLTIGLKNGFVSILDTTNTTGAKIRLHNAAGNHYTQLGVAAAQSTDATFTLPAADGSAGQFLKTDASGNLTFSSTLPANAVLGTPVSGTLTNTTGYLVSALADVAWVAFTPSFTGFSADPSTTGFKYKLIGKTAIVSFPFNAGTSNATGFTITLPVSAASQQWCAAAISANNSGNSATNNTAISVTSNVATIYLAGSATGWTASGSKGVGAVIVFETT